MDSFLVRFPAFLVLDSSPFAYWLLSPLSSFGAGVFCPQLSFCFSSLQCFVTDMPRGGESSRLVCPSVVAHCDAAGSRVSRELITQSHIVGGSVAPRRSNAETMEQTWNRGLQSVAERRPPLLRVICRARISIGRCGSKRFCYCALLTRLEAASPMFPMILCALCVSATLR